MGHEIEKSDGVVLHRERAWHGLGVVVENAPTPTEALQIAGLDWQVEQWPLYATNGEGTRLTIGDCVANVRSDTSTCLGIVGKGYQPVQNRELADFCEALAENGDVVRIESAGSIRGGKRLWFLLKGDSFGVGGGIDALCPYLCVSNGHDGGTAVRCTPTTVRVVCSNTLHMVIPGRDNEAGRLKVKPAAFVARHTRSVKERVEEAKRALQLYGRAMAATREVIDGLAAKDVNRADVQRFFLECYTHDFGAIPSNPATASEVRQCKKAIEAAATVFRRFDDERNIAGTNLWNAFNAYSGWLQNDRKLHVKSAAKRDERRIEGKLFGLDSERTNHALGVAMSLAG